MKWWTLLGSAAGNCSPLEQISINMYQARRKLHILPSTKFSEIHDSVHPIKYVSQGERMIEAVVFRLSIPDVCFPGKLRAKSEYLERSNSTRALVLALLISWKSVVELEPQKTPPRLKVGWRHRKLSFIKLYYLRLLTKHIMNLPAPIWLLMSLGQTYWFYVDHRGLHCASHSQLQVLPATYGHVDAGVKLHDGIRSEVNLNLGTPADRDHTVDGAHGQTGEWVGVHHLKTSQLT